MVDYQDLHKDKSKDKNVSEMIQSLINKCGVNLAGSVALHIQGNSLPLISLTTSQDLLGVLVDDGLKREIK